MSNKLAAAVAAIILAVASIAYAATCTKSGSGPNMTSRSANYVQTLNLYSALPSGTFGTITSVSYRWDISAGCVYLNPFDATCYEMPASGLAVKLCLESGSSFGTPDLSSCVDVTGDPSSISARTGSTTKWHGTIVNTTTMKPRFYLVFRASGSGNISWAGAANSVTVSYQ